METTDPAQEASDAAQVEYHTAKTDAKAKRAAARDLALKVRCCHLLFGVVNIVCLSLRRASIDREPG